MIGMIFRLLHIAVPCWVFLVSPTLCLTGVLAHPCKPDSTENASFSCHADQHSTHSKPTSGNCSHETQCEDDPCNDDLVIREAHELKTSTDLLPHFLASRATDDGIAAAVFVSEREPLRESGLPFHQSDLPLLI